MLFDLGDGGGKRKEDGDGWDGIEWDVHVMGGDGIQVIERARSQTCRSVLLIPFSFIQADILGIIPLNLIEKELSSQ